MRLFCFFIDVILFGGRGKKKKGRRNIFSTEVRHLGLVIYI
jgi:hypothetical protein